VDRLKAFLRITVTERVDEGRVALTRLAQIAKPSWTNFIRKNLAAVVTHAFKQLLDLAHETGVEDGRLQLDVAEVANALGRSLAARRALELAVDGPHARVSQATLARALLSFILVTLDGLKNDDWRLTMVSG
jgi:hypothetical protein